MEWPICLTRPWIAGRTIRLSSVDKTMPPIIGTAMRYITSAPVAWLRMVGKSPAMMATIVIISGHARLTAPVMIAI